MPKMTGVRPRAEQRIRHRERQRAAARDDAGLEVVGRGIRHGRHASAARAATGSACGSTSERFASSPRKSRISRDRRIGFALALQRGQPLGERARPVKQRLIERADLVQPLARELAPPHADDVQTLEKRMLPGGEPERDHVAAHAADAADHRLRADTRELMHGAQATDEDGLSPTSQWPPSVAELAKMASSPTVQS